MSRAFRIIMYVIAPLAVVGVFWFVDSSSKENEVESVAKITINEATISASLAITPDELTRGLSGTKELLEEVSSKSGYFRIKSYGLGKYGRVLADVFIQDKKGKTICVNNQLISEGHAYIYDGGKKKVFTS